MSVLPVKEHPVTFQRLAKVVSTNGIEKINGLSLVVLKAFEFAFDNSAPFKPLKDVLTSTQNFIRSLKIIDNTKEWIVDDIASKKSKKAIGASISFTALSVLGVANYFDSVEIISLAKISSSMSQNIFLGSVLNFCPPLSIVSKLLELVGTSLSILDTLDQIKALEKNEKKEENEKKLEIQKKWISIASKALNIFASVIGIVVLATALSMSTPVSLALLLLGLVSKSFGLFIFLY